MTKQIFVLDSGVIKDIINGTGNGIKILGKMLTSQNFAKFVTSSSSILNAISKSNNNSNMNNLKKFLQVIEINYDDVDFKNQRKVNERIAQLAFQMEGI